MEPQQPGNNLIDELAAKQEAIIDNLGWDELGDKERIERLRKYTKQVINAYSQQYTGLLNGALKRIEQLERHKHDANGRAIIEQHLDTGRVGQDYMTQPMGSPTPNTYLSSPAMTKNTKYI